MQIVAVTGAAGLIGSAVTRQLVARGARVVAIDDFSVGAWTGDSAAITWERVDVLEAASVLDRWSPDAVVHAAAHPGGKSLAEPAEDVRVNALGSMRVFEWCARAHLPVVYTSSSVVYGDQPPGGIPESAPLRPGTIYAVAKVACEQWLKILHEGHDLPWTILRLFSTYGAGHRPSGVQGILNVMLAQLQSGTRVVVRGSLERVRDLVYVDDAARAIVEAVYRPGSRGEVINVGSGRGVSIRQMIEAIARVLGHDLTALDIVEEAGTVGDPFSNVADCGLARAVLGFEPRFTLDEGLRALVAARRSLSA